MIEDHSNFRVKESLIPSKKVIFIFTAFGTKMAIYTPFIKMLNKKGYSCVIYDYPVQMVYDAQIPEWHKFYDDVIADVQTRMKRLGKNGVTRFDAHGTSMGSLLANLLARRTPNIDHIVLNLTYGDVAHAIFTSTTTAKARENFFKQGISQEAFAAAFAYTDPVKNAEDLRGRKVLLYLSKPDKVLPYKDTEHTRRAFERAGVNLTYVENARLGHWLGGAKNLLSAKRLMDFLES